MYQLHEFLPYKDINTDAMYQLYVRKTYKYLTQCTSSSHFYCRLVRPACNRWEVKLSWKLVKARSRLAPCTIYLLKQKWWRSCSNVISLLSFSLYWILEKVDKLRLLLPEKSSCWDVYESPIAARWRQPTSSNAWRREEESMVKISQ